MLYLFAMRCGSASPSAGTLGLRRRAEKRDSKSVEWGCIFFEMTRRSAPSIARHLAAQAALFNPTLCGSVARILPVQLAHAGGAIGHGQRAVEEARGRSIQNQLGHLPGPTVEASWRGGLRSV